MVRMISAYNMGIKTSGAMTDKQKNCLAVNTHVHKPSAAT